MRERTSACAYAHIYLHPPPPPHTHTVRRAALQRVCGVRLVTRTHVLVRTAIGGTPHACFLFSLLLLRRTKSEAKAVLDRMRAVIKGAGYTCTHEFAAGQIRIGHAGYALISECRLTAVGLSAQRRGGQCGLALMTPVDNLHCPFVGGLGCVGV